LIFTEEARTARSASLRPSKSATFFSVSRT
jgi:hypothetical protein